MRRIGLLLVPRHLRRRRLATGLLAHWRSAVPHESSRVVTRRSPAAIGWLTHAGFTCVDDRIVLERLLQRTVLVSPSRLNEYVGRYISEAMPDEPIIIERYGDALVSKARDMRDVLLAASETEFFTRHHDGRGRFERDATGAVRRLVYTSGPRTFVAMRVEG